MDSPQAAAPSGSPAVGYQVGGRYTLRATVGAGGMGTVWKAYDEVLHRDVAVKEVTLPPGVPARERETLCERTLREARAAAALNHPAVIKVFDVVVDDERPWIVMELLDARSIADIVRMDGPMPPQTVATVGLAVLGALETAHRAGILHRDVKPGNVLLDSEGRVTLTDFGVASAPGDTSLTSTGLLLGSPQYIAPERARGQAFGPPSDLWSLGATLYAAVEGRAPFDRGDPLPTMTAVVSDPPHPMTLAGPMAPVLDGLLIKDPAARMSHAQARTALLAAARSDAGPTIPLPLAPADSPSAQSPPTQSLPTRSTSTQSPSAPTPTRIGGVDVRTTPARRKLLLGVAGAVVLLLVAVGAYAAVNAGLATPRRANVGSTSGGATSPSPALTVERTDLSFPAGRFRAGIPQGWTRASGSLERYLRPDAPVWVQFNAERTKGSQRAAWEGAAHRAERLRTVFPDYSTVGFPESTVAGTSAVDWEYTYQRTGESERRHVLDRGVVIDGVSYQMAISAPESQWADAHAVLDAVCAQFQIASTP